MKTWRGGGGGGGLEEGVRGLELEEAELPLTSAEVLAVRRPPKPVLTYGQ